MTVVLVLGAVALVGAVVVRTTWRTSADERQSVRSYHDTLETLRHVADRGRATELSTSTQRKPKTSDRLGRRRPQASQNASSWSRSADTLIGRSVRGGNGGRDDNGARNAAARKQTPVPTTRASTTRSAHDAGAGSSTAGTESRSALAFEDHGAAGSGTRAVPSPAVSEIASRSGVYRRLRSGDAGPPGSSRRSLTTAVATVVLVAVVATAVSLTTGSKKGPRSSQSQRPATAAAGSSSSHRSSSKTKAPTTIQATGSTATGASYEAPASSYTVELAASGPCWVMASQASSGAVLWTGTLQAGGVQRIFVTGPMLLRLGAAFDVSVTLNGAPVVFPSGHGSPYDLSFKSV